ncbi:MAG: ISAs1 family transposase [Parachlamydia sp.]|nr:ISAs1 family transposase [Parachlamydia sp.]
MSSDSILPPQPVSPVTPVMLLLTSDGTLIVVEMKVGEVGQEVIRQSGDQFSPHISRESVPQNIRVINAHAEGHLPDNLEKLLISLVALSVISVKPGTHKGQPTPPHKEVKEPEVIQQKPHVEVMRLEPNAQTEQQNNSSSGKDPQSGSNAFQGKPQAPGENKADNKSTVTPMPAAQPQEKQPQEGPRDTQQKQFPEMPVQPQNDPELRGKQVRVDRENQELPQSSPSSTQKEPLSHAKVETVSSHVPQPQSRPVEASEHTVIPKAAPLLTPCESDKPVPAVRPMNVEKLVEAQASHGRPRVDAVTPKERSDSVANPVVPNRDDQKVEFRLPIITDLPLSREGVLKRMARSNSSQRLEQDGHRLGDVILMMVCAVTCGARSITEIYRVIDARRYFFSAWLGLKQGIPTVRTFEWLLQRLNRERFQDLVDQTLAGRNSFVYQVQVWDSDRGVIFGELQALQKNQSPVLEEMLEHLSLNQAAVTVDMKELNPAIARYIARQDADYIFAIRGVHAEMYEAIQEYFESQPKDVKTFHEAIKDQQRTEQRELTMSHDLSWIEAREQWPRLQSAVRLISEMFVDRRRTTEQRYYLSSLGLPPDAMAANIRLLSFVEKRVQWSLDCDFSRNREAIGFGHAQNNLETLIKQSWLLLEQDQSVKGSFEIKRQQARADNSYLRQLVTNSVKNS